MTGGRGASSAGGGRDDLAPIFAFDEGEKYDEVRRIAGDRGGVALPPPCRELSELRLCRVGVVDRSTLLIEVELGALRRGVLTAFFDPGEGDALPLVPETVVVWTIGDEGGRGVSIAVDNESRCMLSASVPPSLFIDIDMVLWSVFTGSRLWFSISAMLRCPLPLLTAAAGPFDFSGYHGCGLFIIHLIGSSRLVSQRLPF